MKRKLLALILATTMLLAAGCSASGSNSSSASKDAFKIITSFYPIYITTINITKDIPDVEVENMTEPQTGCLHDYQLKPDDLVALESADAFVINGAGMESFIQDVLDQQADLSIVEASKDLPVLIEENGEENPHLWVSVSNAIKQAQNIADQLAELDSAHAELYRKNAETYIAKLEALRTEMHTAIDPLKNRDIITFHEAFPYFAQEFNLNIVTVIEREPGTSPTAQELAATINTVKNSGIKALFAEPQYSSGAAQTIAAETDAQVYYLDPVVTGEADKDYDAYINRMKENMQVLVEALQR